MIILFKTYSLFLGDGPDVKSFVLPSSDPDFKEQCMFLWHPVCEGGPSKYVKELSSHCHRCFVIGRLKA